MVSNDVMRLEMKRLRGILNGAADEVFSLENRRQQLNMSMKERKAEIQVTKIDAPWLYNGCDFPWRKTFLPVPPLCSKCTSNYTDGQIN